MKWLPVLFLIFLHDLAAQVHTRKVGFSDCTCDTIEFKDIQTSITEYYPNGKEAKKVMVSMFNECRIQDTSVIIFDTLGNMLSLKLGDYALYKTYDEDGLLLSEAIVSLNEDTIHRQFDYTLKQNVIQSERIIENGEVISVTQYGKRKNVTQHLKKRIKEVRKYDKNGRLILFRTKAVLNEYRTDVLEEKNTYDRLGNITTSVFKQNGKTKVSVKVLYKNGQEWLESRIFYETGTMISTEYRYE